MKYDYYYRIMSDKMSLQVNFAALLSAVSEAMPDLAYNVNVNGSKNILDVGQLYPSFQRRFLKNIFPQQKPTNCAFSSRRLLEHLVQIPSSNTLMVFQISISNGRHRFMEFIRCLSKRLVKIICANLASTSVAFDSPESFRLIPSQVRFENIL